MAETTECSRSPVVPSYVVPRDSKDTGVAAMLVYQQKALMRNLLLKAHHRQPRRVVSGVHLKIEKGENICNSTK